MSPTLQLYTGATRIVLLQDYNNCQPSEQSLNYDYIDIVTTFALATSNQHLELLTHCSTGGVTCDHDHSYRADTKRTVSP